MGHQNDIVPADNISSLIRSILDQRIILDTDLARLYGVQTFRLNETGNREVSLFHSAMELPTPEARAAFLREACARDDQLRERLEAILRNTTVMPSAALMPANQAPRPIRELAVTESFLSPL
jgi:hypothetical protein